MAADDRMAHYQDLLSRASKLHDRGCRLRPLRLRLVAALVEFWPDFGFLPSRSEVGRNRLESAGGGAHHDCVESFTFEPLGYCRHLSLAERAKRVERLGVVTTRGICLRLCMPQKDDLRGLKHDQGDGGREQHSYKVPTPLDQFEFR